MADQSPADFVPVAPPAPKWPEGVVVLPADDLPPEIVIDQPQKEPSTSTGAKKNKGGRPRKNPRPDVNPAPREPDVSPLFADGPVEPAREAPREPVKVKLKKAVDPKKIATKAAGWLSEGAQFVAESRYGNLTCPMQLPGQDVATTVRIADLAKTSPEEDAEVADALADVIGEMGIELTATQLALFVVLGVYGKRAVVMEKMARSAQKAGTLGGVKT